MSNLFHNPIPVPEDVLIGLKKHREAGQGVDLCIVVEGRSIFAHRSVLMASGAYFEALLGPNWKEGNSEQIHLQYFKFDPLSQVIDYIYTGKILFDETNVQDLLETADFLKMDDICKACSDFMRQRINHANCVDMFNLALSFCQEGLQEAARTFIVGNMWAVVKGNSIKKLSAETLAGLLNDCSLNMIGSDSKVSPSMQNFEAAVLDVVLEWKHNIGHVDADTFLNLLKAVRLPQLPLKSLRGLLEHPLLVDLPKDAAKILIQAAMEKGTAPNPKWRWPRKLVFAGLDFTSSQVFAEVVRRFGMRVELFDHKTVVKDISAFITGMDLYFQRWHGKRDGMVLAGLAVYYSNGITVRNGVTLKEDGDQNYRLRLEEGERIKKVEVYSGYLIDKLTFYTSDQRKLGGFGDRGGGLGSSTAPEAFGYLSYVSGEVIRDLALSIYIRELKFHWGHFKFPNYPNSFC